jgi:hypothetical protein
MKILLKKIKELKLLIKDDKYFEAIEKNKEITKILDTFKRSC